MKSKAGLRRTLAAITTLSIAFAGQTSATAESAKEFYKGKTVSVLVPFGPGGGYDTYARLMAPYFSDYLGATFVVQNKPGAGGLLGLGQIYTAEADGTNLVFFQGTGAAAAQIVGTKNVRFDLTKMSYIATVAYSPWLMLATKKLPVNDVGELKNFKKTIVWAGTGPMASGSTGSRFICAAMKLNCRVVLGFKGSKDSALALARGEVDAYYVSDSSADKYVRAGNAKPIMIVGGRSSRFFPGMKPLFEIEKLDADAKWLIGYHNKLEGLGRLLAGPAGLPADRLALLRTMAKTILNDPKFVAAAEKRKRFILYNNAENTVQAIKDVVINVTPEQKARVLKLLKGS